ncbi:hypothetical protein EJ06DRAFT_510463 [Trichodelitschia bisporula]|uniref:Distal membrane-arm assembly complex protein 1-like domain-containing protein n=1 Tax=Trichodelitschia bisporula TaxID=703511 RepID=A0A6G1HWD6_9PEZI|nr:hypothetical protein EJ06DRAFT_510463 [Trichodelitschia bisporula]
MAKEDLQTIAKLEQPPKLTAMLAEDKKEVYGDCTPCRVVGASAFVGLAAYGYFSGHHQLRQQEAKILKSGSIFGMRSRRAGITGSALVLAAMGFWRLVN